MKKVLSLVLALVMIVAVFASCGAADTKTIAVVAKGESHAFWQSVKAGAEAAGSYLCRKYVGRLP